MYGTAETRDAGRRALPSGWLPPMVWHDVADGVEVDIGGLRAAASPAPSHYVETLAVRVDDVEIGVVAGLLGRHRTRVVVRRRSGAGIDLALCEATNLADKDEARACST